MMGWTTTQTVTARSSGEAEYYGVTNILCQSTEINTLALIQSLPQPEASQTADVRTKLCMQFETRTLSVQDKIAQDVVLVRNDRAYRGSRC